MLQEIRIIAAELVMKVSSREQRWTGKRREIECKYLIIGNIGESRGTAAGRMMVQD